MREKTLRLYLMRIMTLALMLKLALCLMIEYRTGLMNFFLQADSWASKFNRIASVTALIYTSAFLLEELKLGGAKYSVQRSGIRLLISMIPGIISLVSSVITIIIIVVSSIQLINVLNAQ